MGKKMQRFQVNAPETIHQTIDGEVVIINLGSGNYYSLRGSGAQIWELMTEGHDVSAIADAIRARYDGAGNDVVTHVERLVEELRTERLVVADGTKRNGAEVPPAAGDLGTFEPPTLEKFDDLQDLILLDPVHEVGEDEGWPHPRTGHAD